MNGPFKISITINDKKITATMNDSEATKDFLKLLPLSLTLTDYASTEKVSDLPTNLSTKGTPDGIAASTGDITYYAPWGNLAIFYKGFGFAKGLVKLGRIDSDVEIFAVPGSMNVRLESLNEQ